MGLDRPVKVIAHRGASGVAPENTVEAFRLAREMGADWVELDARRSADGALVVHHDANLGDGRVICELTRAELGTSVCDLDEALDACAGMSVNIEIKNHPDDVDFDPTQLVARGVVDLVADRGERNRVLISCFHQPTIDEVRRMDPQIATAMLGYQPAGTWSDWARDLAAAGHRSLHPWYPMVNPVAVAEVHEAGMVVNVWTVNDPDHMVALIEAGVDGLCTDVPDVARAVIDAL